MDARAILPFTCPGMRGTPCILEGCKAVRDALIDELKRRGLDEEIRVVETGCLGHAILVL